MWVITGVLLGLVALFTLLGFHTGPHSQLAAGGLGAITAIWLIVLAATGNSSAMLWSLLSADVVVSGGAGVVAWKGLQALRDSPSGSRLTRLEGTIGTVTTDLTPEGIVRVNGENWSATSLNGTHKAGTSVQVVSVAGVRLEVWGDASSLDAPATGEIASSSANEPRTGIT